MVPCNVKITIIQKWILIKSNRKTDNGIRKYTDGSIEILIAPYSEETIKSVRSQSTA